MTRLAATIIWIAMGALPASANTLNISDAWSPPGEKARDLPVYFTITNSGDADDLLRFKCPGLAHFTEKRTTDYGEGSPSAREVKSIAVAASGKTELKPGGEHLSLLQITQPAIIGDKYACEVSFKRAGQVQIEVTIKDAPPS